MQNLPLQPLTAIGPVDGRYHSKTAELSGFFSEFGLIRYRVLVEVEYFIALAEGQTPGLPALNDSQKQQLRAVYQHFGLAEAEKIKATEAVTNHDVKAVEYFVKDALQATGLGQWKEFVHFGLTSQDINNTAVPLSLKDAAEQVILPALQQLLQQLKDMAFAWQDQPMLAFTHGQPASPTLLGKELAVYVYRLQEQLAQLKAVPFAAKFGGATGNLNAHHVACPEIDWVAFANSFVEKQLGLKRSRLTTQIENYDYLAAYFDNLKRINTILTDLCRDCWQYISMGYFKQIIKEGEVGSSAMPHKVNPIDFENAEGNLGLGSALLEHLASKLPVSRLQRDLTDSTVLRNIGLPLSYLLIAVKSVGKGLGKLQLNPERLQADLENNWAVLAEAIQTVLRREGYPQPYEALKDLTRGKASIGQQDLHVFVDGLGVSEEVKNRLKKLTPQNYTGIPLQKQWPDL